MDSVLLTYFWYKWKPHMYIDIFLAEIQPHNVLKTSNYFSVTDSEG